MSRALWYNTEMQDGVKHFLATMCPFAFTVDDSHTEATSKLEMYGHIDQIFIYNFSKAIGSQMALS